VQAIRFARVCVEEAMKYASKRKTFGKLLIEHPVIRFNCKPAHVYFFALMTTHRWAWDDEVASPAMHISPHTQN